MSDFSECVIVIVIVIFPPKSDVIVAFFQYDFIAQAASPGTGEECKSASSLWARLICLRVVMLLCDSEMSRSSRSTTLPRSTVSRRCGALERLTCTRRWALATSIGTWTKRTSRCVTWMDHWVLPFSSKFFSVQFHHQILRALCQRRERQGRKWQATRHEPI